MMTEVATTNFDTSSTTTTKNPFMTQTSTATGGQASPNRKKKRRLYYLIGGVIAVVVIIVVVMMNRKPETGIMVTTEKAAIRTITQIVTATGKVNPEVEVKLSPEASGEIIELPVKEGQKVKKGDLLFRINPLITREVVGQNEAALASAKAQNLQQKARLLQSEEEYRRAQKLFTDKLSSETEYLTAKTNVEVAKANYEASVFDIQRLESSLRQAREQLSRTSVFAPMNGTVSLLSAKLGERVVGTATMAGTEIMRVADLGKMEVRVDVNENDIVNVKIGDTARVGVDAYPNRKFTGVVYEIANTARTTGLGTQEEVTNFTVKIRIIDHELLLRPGMSATADIETKSVSNVVTVPIQSVTVRAGEGGLSAEEVNRKREEQLKQSGGDAEAVNEKMKAQQEKADKAKFNRVVFVKSGDIVLSKTVETGIADNSYIEIKSGINDNDEVVSGPYRAISRELRDSSKVSMEVKEQKKK
ncbi:MAG: efflux RND transporter periplasmic adaptor subunit [Chloroherpetonaceae bacterium]|nr:efflux RND transporter periplasmic adaptor subunit [Chloroherpetonaceae bacterium]